MSTASRSSASSALRRRGPFILLIECPTCRRLVKQSRSSTKEHRGWVYYKCHMHGHGCDFWHWELEYVCFLIDEEILRGDAAVEALGWAEERREQLNLRQEERAATFAGHDEMLMNHLSSVLVVLKEAVLLLKIGVGLLAMLCVLVVMKK